MTAICMELINTVEMFILCKNTVVRLEENLKQKLICLNEINSFTLETIYTLPIDNI